MLVGGFGVGDADERNAAQTQYLNAQVQSMMFNM